MPAIGHFALYMMSLVGQLGYFGVYLVIGLEYACFPIPSEIVLPFVGMSIPQTQLQFLPAFLVSILAGLSGSLACYGIGYYGGNSLLQRLAVKSKNLRQALQTFNCWFESYGRWAVLFSRVIPLTRTYISLFAGASCMSVSEFLLYSATGIALWNLVLMGLGLYLGNNWSMIEGLLNTYSNIILTLLAILIVTYITRKCLHKKRQIN